MTEQEVVSLEVLQRAMPRQVKKNITAEHVEHINAILLDPAVAENYRDTLLSYTSVMTEGRYKMQSYLDAVRYVSHKLLGDSDIVSYTKTFPERYQHYLDTGVEQLQIASVSRAYKKTQLVTKILELTIVPVHILNADLHQKAINRLADLMMNARSEHVQSISAAKLVDALKLPETIKMELDIGIKEDNSIKELRDSTMKLVAQQRLMIEAGALTVKEIAHSKIIAEEAIDAELIKEQ